MSPSHWEQHPSRRNWKIMCVIQESGAQLHRTQNFQILERSASRALPQNSGITEFSRIFSFQSQVFFSWIFFAGFSFGGGGGKVLEKSYDQIPNTLLQIGLGKIFSLESSRITSVKTKRHKHKIFGPVFCRLSWPLHLDAQGQKVCLHYPGPASAGTRAVWCGRPRFFGADIHDPKNFRKTLYKTCLRWFSAANVGAASDSSVR